MSAFSFVTGTRARVAAVVASAAVVLSGCSSVYDVNLPGGADVGKDPITVHVMFRDVLDLVPQSTVKVDDVTVGRVSAVKLKGYVADVTLLLPKDIDLPDNAQAEIRQTSLLGEKFVSLKPPATGAEGRLGNGDTIGLDRTGRNPEVEEVLGALSLLLNGGGVGQLKTIAAELNNAFGGREDEVRSVLDQLRSFMGQLAANKTQIIATIDSLDRLAVQLKRQDGTIRNTLDDLPSAIASINTQRADLVRTLKALQNLSGIGVKVIQASKEATINSLRDLAPTLDKLADAGQALPRSLQVSLTYPFVDEAVGRDPQVARNLHLGDFVNLDVRLDVDLTQLPAAPSVPVPTEVCNATEALKKQFITEAKNAVALLPDVPFKTLKAGILKDVIDAINALHCSDPLNQQVFEKLLADAIAKYYKALTPAQIQQLVTQITDALGGVMSTPAPGAPSITIPNPLGGILKGLGRTAADYGASTGSSDGAVGDVLNGAHGTAAQIGYNSTLGALLLQGVLSK